MSEDTCGVQMSSTRVVRYCVKLLNTAKIIGGRVYSPICSLAFYFLVSVLTQYSAFIITVLSNFGNDEFYMCF